MTLTNPNPCPHLPEVSGSMNHRCLSGLPKSTPKFYYNALQYGQYLWLKGHAGRAILAVTRALYADIEVTDPVRRDWPLPYAALRWIVASHSSDNFPGNPRISFQHQATRLRGERQALRRARAWAVWSLILEVRPSLPGDEKDPVEPPTTDQIKQRLSRHGDPGEAELWHSVLQPNHPLILP